LVSVGRLLKVSPDIRALYLQYPEAAAQNILKEVPQPVGSLIRVAWALHNVKKEDFDAENALDLLRYNELHEWPVLFPQLFTVKEDPLESIRGLVDLYVEVDSAVELVAQGMNALTEAFVNPHVVVAPIALSETEHIRLTCALLIVRIYYQLRSKFGPVHDIATPAYKFRRTFIESLKPWQVEQAVAVEGFVEKCLMPHTAYIYKAIDTKYRCGECFSAKSSYFRKYKTATANDADFSTREFIGYDPNTGAPMTKRPMNFSGAARIRNQPPMSMSPFWDYNDDAQLSPDVIQLRNDGWILYNSIGLYGRLRRPNHEREHLALGVFFWDRDRLASWDLVNLDDITRLHENVMRKLEYMASVHEYVTEFWGCRCCRSTTHCEIREARQIREWTRSPVQCTLEEFLYRKTAKARIAEGHKPVPRKYVEPSVICRFCGLEGHRSARCEEENWSDDEGDGVKSQVG
jgi:hypothetical protein